MSFEIFKKLSAKNITKEQVTHLIQIFIFGIWIFLQYSFGNKVYAGIIVAFFALLIMLRWRSYTLLAIALLTVALLNTNTIGTLAKLKQSNLEAFQNPNTTLSNILSPGSGQAMLPIKVQQMTNFLKANNVSSYDLSNLLVQDVVMSSQTIETAWPIKLRRKSHYLLCYVEEIKLFYSSCDVIDQKEDVALVRCK